MTHARFTVTIEIEPKELRRLLAEAEREQRRAPGRGTALERGKNATTGAPRAGAGALP